MLLNVFDQIGDSNPQFFREIKGRLNPRNILITGAASGIIQFIVFQGFKSELPVVIPGSPYRDEAFSKFCKGDGPRCFKLADGSFDINWQWWWLHIFTWLSVIMLFILLVGGTYLLINDLAREEKRGTLNFLRLTPQPTQNLLIGKILGVPILLYLFTAFMMPLHLWSAVGAELSVKRIVLFYSLVVASCIFFFSAAMLFAFAASWLNGFQAWLGSGILLCFLSISMAWLQNGYPIENATAWLRLFSPLEVSSYLFPFSTVYSFNAPSTLEKLQFLKWNTLGNSWMFICLTFGNYALWTYWVWQGLNRCFRNPNITLFSKKQSYGFVACCQVLSFGFAVPLVLERSRLTFETLLVFNFLLFLGLIATLVPHRSALYDWSRYRYQEANQGKGFGKFFLDKDVVFSEKSPAVVAIAINLAIAAIPVIALFGLKLLGADGNFKQYTKEFIFSVALFASLMMIFTTVAQRMLLLSNPKRSLLATLTIASLIILPPIMLTIVRMHPYNHPNLWLFTAFPWAGIETASTTAMFMALLSEVAVFVVLNGNLRRQLRIAGESETKALISH